MSIRGTKRVMGLRGEEAGASKRRKAEQEEALWQLRPVSDLKISSIYNRSASEAPAELFRKDLISAMKLPDSEPLTSQEYWIITDTWKQEWERGVQVPVNPDSLPAPAVQEIDNPLPPNFQEFKIPKNKYIHLTRDAFYQSDIHQLSTAATRAESACKYDLDAIDSTWLKVVNGERARAGNSLITEDQLERVIQELELRCWDKIQAIMKSEEGLGIEYDENVICDVCRSPDSEEGNEMVFCDACNICVHQACYGITTIPSGQWLCRPCRICTTSTRPTCVLCPNLGGAMKCTPSGHKWAHVSCVLWIPEVSIGCAEKMEPITKISAIPPSRWSLLCVLCRERKGACIQCSVKTCKTAYHVTCAFKHGLEMRAIIEDENADDGVKLRSYCQKHSVNSKKEKNAGSGSEEDEVKRKRRKDMTSEEKSQARAQRLRDIEAEFDKHVSIKDISSHVLDVDQDAVGYIYCYWKIKRRAGRNRPLLPPKADDSDLLSHRQEQADLDKMKMFVQLRQDLERVRNLCYMVSRREKLSRSFFRMREQTFHKQVAVLSEQKDLNASVISAVIEANHGPSIYDKMYSHPEASDNSSDFDSMVARIAGEDSEEDKKNDINGLIKSSKSTTNPYKKVYVNGSTRRSSSMFSGMSSEDSAPEITGRNKYRSRSIGSSSEEGVKPSFPIKKKVSPVVKSKAQPKTERKKRVPSSRAMVESSSEEDIKPIVKKEKSAGRSRTLKALEREMSARLSGTDSDELVTIKGSRNVKFPINIYSDSSDTSSPAKVNEFSEEKSPNATNDSQQQLPRTKAAMKQFIPMLKSERDKHSNKSGRKSSTSKDKLPDSDEEEKKENVKYSKSKDYPSDLIVPQRQAAKKASENMRSTTKGKDTETTVDVKPSTSTEDVKFKPKQKLKGKDKETPIAKDHTRKKNLLCDSQDLDKEEKDNQEQIAYVPQRQAAKKAAAHIKSGLGSKLTSADMNEENKKRENDTGKRSPQKDEDKQSKSSSRSSSCSSSNSSSSSCSSSSSSEDEDDKSASSKSVDVKPSQPRERSLFSPLAPRPSVDLPFLDKVSRPLSSSSPSSDSNTPKEWERTGSPARKLKRGRPQKSESSSISDEIPQATPDKKLKTSERRSECGISSPAAEGEERDRTSDARPAACAGARSNVSSGDMFDERNSTQRKSIANDSDYSYAEIKSSKDDQPSEPAPAKWKGDEALNLKKSDRHVIAPRNEIKVAEEDNIENANILEENENKSQKPPDILEKPATIPLKQANMMELSSPLTERFDHTPNNSKADFPKMSTHRLSPSPTIDMSSKNNKPRAFGDLNSSIIENSSHLNEPKTWDLLKKNAGPPPAIEKYGDTEKYMSEDKSMDERSSFKMIAKIHANLNEIMMIKSPKTPMDATSGSVDTYDMETHPENKPKKHSSALELQKKLQIGAARVPESSLQNAEPKKIPQPGSNYPNRSMFSPQPTMKDNACNDLFEFGNNILAVDDSVSDGFGNEEIMKPFSFNSEFLFKEDSKEDKGVQETLNLVEKLRMTLSSKKPTIDNSEQETLSSQLNEKEDINRQEEVEKPTEGTDNKDQQSPENSMQDVDKSQPSNFSFAPSNESTEDIPQEHIMVDENSGTTPDVVDIENTTEKWHHIPLATPDPHIQIEDHHMKYDKYEGKPYEEKDYDEKEYEDKQYDDKHYDEKQYNNKYEEKQFVEKHYEDKHYEEPQYEDKRYEEKMYDDKYEEHLQYRHHLGRHKLDKHPIALSHNIPSSVDQEHFRDNFSKQSDDSRSINDQSINSNDQDTMMQESVRSQSYENNNSLPQSDCATISSPRSESKWGESKITHRRSSASSTNSEGSVCSQKLQMKPHLPQSVLSGGMIRGMDYANVQPFPCPPLEAIPYSAFASEASPFVAHGSVSLFQPGPSAQLPLQSPGAGLYPPNLGIPYSSTSMISNLSKPFTTMCAAFATSSQNLVLTTPIISPPTPKTSIEESPPDDMDLSTEKSYSAQASPTPSADSFNDTSSGRCGISKLSNESNDTICTHSTLESRSSTKPIKTPGRFMGSSIKSPGKSPGISPKTAEALKSTSNKRSTSTKNNRGRGRGRSKTRAHPHYATGNVDFHGNSIHSKLIGTVYELDFDEETANDGVDLKAMRERRRSVDAHDRKSESSCKDSSQSPRVPSPTQPVVKISPVPTDIKETKPPPATSIDKKSEGSPRDRASTDPQFPAIVQPVLPGPVDMRRYQPLETPTPAREPFHSHLLGAFESVPHQPLVEIDEDIEKELHTALMATASNPETSPTKSPIPEIPEPPVPFTPEAPLPKVSLSDSRNQLKVKIKGPFRDANYCASVQPPVPQPPQPTYEPPPGILGTPSAVASVTSAMLAGTSNLRRMRKKELLRQYWTQDMNMDDPAGNPSIGTIPPPIQQSPLNRTIITIPKAVASMTTIPTREDYKAVVDANMEKKKRKTAGERELRHLQVTMNDDLDADDLFPNFSGTISQPPSRKCRGRAATKPNKVTPPAPVTPKLKIKIGSNIVHPVPPEDPTSGFQFRPPKKRLTPKEVVPPTPSYEDLRRESMRFRKMMMAEFEVGKKEKKHKPKGDKPEKKKKKKGKKTEKMQVVNSKSDSATKLVIKITRNKEEGCQPATERPAVPIDPFEYDPAAPDPLAIDPPSYSESCGLRKVRASKVTPIRLKLSRSSEGSGYVMKNSTETSGGVGGRGACPSEQAPSADKHSDVR